MSDRFEKAARMLADLRRGAKLATAFPEALAPNSIADGYAIQDRFRALWAEPVAGWKIGATAAAVQTRFGVNEPFAGPYFSPDVFASPARPHSARFPHHCLESEFAFRFARRVSPRSATYGRDEIRAVIDAVLPVFEIVGPRFDTLLFSHPATAVADCGLNAGFVLGKPVSDWLGLELSKHGVRLSVAGKVKAEGSGANVLGDPMNVLDWAVNHLSGRGIAIEPGQLISTGTTTGIAYIAPGETAIADFGTLGSVEIRFDGPPPQRLVPPPA